MRSLPGHDKRFMPVLRHIDLGMYRAGLKTERCNLRKLTWPFYLNAMYLYWLTLIALANSRWSLQSKRCITTAQWYITVVHLRIPSFTLGEYDPDPVLPAGDLADPREHTTRHSQGYLWTLFCLCCHLGIRRFPLQGWSKQNLSTMVH